MATTIVPTRVPETGPQTTEVHIADPPEILRSALASLAPAHQEQFVRFGQGPAVAPRHQLIHEAFEARAAERPLATAVEHQGSTITYGHLDAHANRLAQQLIELGVRPGDNVALFLSRSIPMVVGMLGTLKVGAAYVPQHVGVAPASQLQHVANEIGASVVLTLSDLLDELPDLPGTTVIAIDALMAAAEVLDDPSTLAATAPSVDVSPDHRCFILFTSGTTGRPNGVQVTHGNVCNVLLTSPGDLGMRPGMRVGQILSIAFDMAAWETLGALMNGATLVIRGRDIQAVAEQVDVIIATPSILGSIDATRCQQVSVVAVAGEPCPKPLADTWGAFARFHNSCGPTETTIINTAQHYRPEVGHLTIGRPTPNNTVYVLDEQRRPLPIGEVGEMWAGGDCVTAGYLHNPELTAERYAPDPFLGEGRMMFRTRDLGRWTADGQLEHFGRTDDQVKIRGFRVELDSVSAALETAAGCTAAVALKYDDRTLVAFVQPETVDVEAAAEAVADMLPYYCVPARVQALAELPRTSRGKVDKRLLLEQAKAEGVAR
ncbi:MAG: amino acid adenylation domain-containing protein [Actinomycetota bacterium]